METEQLNWSAGGGWRPSVVEIEIRAVGEALPAEAPELGFYSDGDHPCTHW